MVRYICRKGDYMNIDLTRLKNSIDEYIEIDEKIENNKEYSQNTELIDLKNTTVKGTIIKNSVDDIIVDITLDGTMVLPCAITLKPVDYKFNCIITGNIEELTEEIEKNDKKYENSIDILPIIWENILMEMPIRVVSDDLSDAKIEGEVWKIITEKENEYINPELAKLKDLLKD